MRWVAILATLIALPLGAQAPCHAALNDPRVTGLAAMVERVAHAPVVWDEYAVTRHPVLFVLDTAYRGAGATPACVVVWRSGVPLRTIELAAAPALSTPLYGFVSLDPSGPRAQPNTESLVAASRRIGPDDIARLRTAGITRAVTVPVPIDYGRLGALGDALRSSGTDPAMILADLVVHEGFHLHVQFPAWMDQPRTMAWPAWDVPPDRGDMRARCYAGTPEVAAVFSREMDALLAAFDALHGDVAARDTAAAIAQARRAIALRAERHALLDTVRVAQGARRIPCSLAEDHLELEEGATQWIAHATLADAGVRALASFRGSYGAPQPDAFYRTGPLQLWVLEGLVGREALHRMTAEMARSTGPSGGVFARFAARVTGRPEGPGTP